MFCDIVHDLLPVMDVNDTICPDEYCETLKDVLLYAARHSMPRPSSRSHKQTWDGNVSRAMAANKTALREWHEGGKPLYGSLYDHKKQTKKTLRQALRQANAKNRMKIYEDITVAAATKDPKLFHKLIQKQRSSPNISGEELLVGDELITSRHEVLEVWTDHFKNLATPQDSPNFDTDYHNFINEDLLVMQWIALNSTSSTTPVKPSEVTNALRSLNSGKAADVFGLKAEHLKVASDVIAPYLANIFNSILVHGHNIPSLNEAYILPIHKKGKDRLLTDNYRGITITPILAKTLEHIILSRIGPKFHQAPLQFGFTKNLSPSMAALTVTEAIAEAIDNRSPLYVIALDVKKAFDVVSFYISYSIHQTYRHGHSYRRT